MLTRPNGQWINKYPAESWGAVKGAVRHIFVDTRKAAPCAVYAIEEGPGWKTIRFNHRKYRVFCPWTYFIIRVWGFTREPGKFNATSGNSVYVFLSKYQHVDHNQTLQNSFFSNSKSCCLVCMPDKSYEANHPLEVVFDLIWNFWASDGTEYPMKQLDNVPSKLLKITRSTPPGRIFGAWSRLSPSEAMNLNFVTAKQQTLYNACEHLNFDDYE